MVGGGIRAPDEWKTLQDAGVKFSCILSANSHGFRLPGCKPDFIWCNDTVHSETREPMEPLLRQYGVPIISRHWWADYRAGEWALTGNSGLNAIAVAVILGGRPVIPIGFDCFQEGVHFWEPDAQNVCKGKPLHSFQPRIAKLRAAVGAAAIRPLSGPLCGEFPRWRRGEMFDTVHTEPPLVEQHRALAGYYARAKQPFTMSFDKRAEIPEGAPLALSEYELTALLARGMVEAITRPPSMQPLHRQIINKVQNFRFRA